MYAPIPCKPEVRHHSMGCSRFMLTVLHINKFKYKSKIFAVREILQDNATVI